MDSFLSDIENNEYSTISFWDTKEDALAAVEHILRVYLEIPKAYVECPPTLIVYHVHDPSLVP